ncbi:MAG: hypothetical protein R2867_45035 [Caldilineaceae bacterium]
MSISRFEVAPTLQHGFMVQIWLLKWYRHGCTLFLHICLCRAAVALKKRTGLCPKTTQTCAFLSKAKYKVIISTKVFHKVIYKEVTMLIFARRGNIQLFAGTMMYIGFTLLLTACPVSCCAQSPTVNLCQELGGNYQSAATINIAEYSSSDAYCSLPDESICELSYSDQNTPQCTPREFVWQPIDETVATDIMQTLAAGLRESEPWQNVIVPLDDGLARAKQGRFGTPFMPFQPVEDAATLFQDLLRPLGWQEDPESISTVYSPQFQLTTIYRSQYTNEQNRCDLVIDWLLSSEFLQCPDGQSDTDCILENPQSYTHIVTLTCYQPAAPVSP